MNLPVTNQLTTMSRWALAHGSYGRGPGAAPRSRPVVWLCLVLPCWALWLPASADAQGIDRVRRTRGTDSGTITKISPLAVTLSKGGVESKIPVADIRMIDFAGEPEDLRPARLAATAGRYQAALQRLAKIPPGSMERQAIRQDLDYWQMYCQVRLAVAGQGPLEQAVQAATSFLSTHRGSFHVPAALELAGEALLASGQYEDARAQFAKLARAKAPYFVARSAVLTGMAWQREDEHESAIQEFDRALAAAQQDALAQPQQLEATLHRAISRSALGHVPEATEVVKTLIAQTPAEDTRLLARAYNALGDCYLQSDQAQAARDAFLHVDVLFQSEPAAHAKALYELSRLWNRLGQASRAAEAQQRLEKDYPESKWARP